MPVRIQDLLVVRRMAPTPAPFRKPPPPPIKIPGCLALSGITERMIAPRVRTYCSGIKEHPARGTGGTILRSDWLIQYMDTCRAEVLLTPTEEEGKTRVGLSHKESTVMATVNWKARQEAMSDVLEARFNLSCSPEPGEGRVLFCDGLVDNDKLRTLATFLSNLGNLDQLEDRGCITSFVRQGYRRAVTEQKAADITAIPMKPYDIKEWRELCQALKEKKPRSSGTITSSRA